MTEYPWTDASLEGFVWAKSSYSSNGGGKCVEVGWRTSSYSSNGGGKCVEAGPVLSGERLYAVRDSRQRERGALVFTPREWSAFVETVKGDAY